MIPAVMPWSSSSCDVVRAQLSPLGLRTTETPTLYHALNRQRRLGPEYSSLCFTEVVVSLSASMLHPQLCTLIITLVFFCGSCADKAAHLQDSDLVWSGPIEDGDRRATAPLAGEGVPRATARPIDDGASVNSLKAARRVPRIVHHLWFGFTTPQPDGKSAS